MKYHRTIVSAPGKVLITGGYLVLDQRFDGLTLGIDSRFYVDIKGSEDSRASSICTFFISSPQFLDGSWTYTWDTELQILAGTGENKFVEACLRFCLMQISIDHLNSSQFTIKIQGDNDFYSQSQHLDGSTTIESLSNLARFKPSGVMISNVKKTGLGSSAAMTTSLVFGLLLHFGIVSVQPDGHIIGIDLVLKMAQVCHCYAQGKIGSGFDVSSAIYGSHSYQRFSTKLLDTILSQDIVTKEALHEAISKPWDHRIEHFSLPPGFLIQLGDITTGSNTPSMVSKLTKWRSANLERCESIWTNLNSCNLRVKAGFRKLSDQHASDPERSVVGL